MPQFNVWRNGRRRTGACNGSAINWAIHRLDAEYTATGSVTTDLPANTALLQMYAGVGNLSTGVASVLNFFGLGIVTNC